ncbi:hypothetical protein SNEBB_010335 [Seison nebaliae]|nr:hypothetical protein SNEBB_010335 [Seison nebaliae]
MKSDKKISLENGRLTILEGCEIPWKVSNKVDQITAIDISENVKFYKNHQKTKFEIFLNYPNLRELIMDRCEIDSIDNFPPLNELEILWINHNKITNLLCLISNIEKKFPHLNYLSMIDNPASPSYFNNNSYQVHKDYRQFVIYRLPNLRILDDREVKVPEKSEAMRVYNNIHNLLLK